MANPTFNGIALTTAAAYSRAGSRRVRIHTETVPGCDGLHVQTHGHAGRSLLAGGLLTASGATAASARDAVMTAFAQREALADGATIAGHVATDGQTYANCMLQSITHGPVRIAATSAVTFMAYLPVEARLLQLTP